MRRRCELLDILALVSLLLCVAAAGLWKGSCSIDDHFGRLQITSTNSQVVEHRTGLFSGDGRLTLGWGIIADTPADYVLRSFGTRNPPNIDRFGWSTGPSLSWFHDAHAEDFIGGFGTAKAYGGKTWNDEGRDFVTIPYWYLVMLLALLPIWRVMVIAGVPLGRRPFRLFLLALGFMLLLGTSLLLLQEAGHLSFLQLSRCTAAYDSHNMIAPENGSNAAYAPAAATISAPRRNAAPNADKRK